LQGDAASFWQIHGAITGTDDVVHTPSSFFFLDFFAGGGCSLSELIAYLANMPSPSSSSSVDWMSTKLKYNDY